MALGTLIRLGDAVAVLGSLKTGEKDIFLEGGDTAMVTNDPKLVTQLSTIPAAKPPGGTTSTCRVLMRKTAATQSAGD